MFNLALDNLNRNMKATFAFVLMCAIVLANAHMSRQKIKPYRTYNRNYYSPSRPKRIVGRTSDGQPCPEANGCIQLPDDNDVMTRAVFESQVAGVKNYVMYRIHQPYGTFQRQENIFFIQGNTLYGDIIGRQNETTCSFFDDLPLGDYISTDRAITQVIGLPYINVGPHNSVFYFMSDNPSVYLIMFNCFEATTIRNGFCEGEYYVDINMFQDPPNNPPFKQIEEELCRKLGLNMDDPNNLLIYNEPGCPFP